MEEINREKEDIQKRKAENEKKIKEIKQKLKEVKEAQGDVGDLEKKLIELEKKSETIKKEEQEFQKKEKLLPWNVDTISKPGFAKTVINKKPPRLPQENLTEEEREKQMKQFFKEHEKDLKHFGMLQKYDDSKAFLKSHSDLVCENTANYLVSWCINLAMEDKHDLMGHVAHQTICMQYILELAKQLDCDPRSCVSAFFSRIQLAEKDYLQSFQDEIEQFKGRVSRRAAEKLEEAMKEVEEEEKHSRLGPGGLDPAEVYNSLPDSLKKCFDTRDVSMLQETISKMDEEEAKYHMKRCVDSGLWIADAKDESGDKDEGETAGNKSK